MKTKKVTHALNQIRNTIEFQIKDLSRSEYREVLEEIDADIEGRLDALAEEGG